jgi:hypothetical protein
MLLFLSMKWSLKKPQRRKLHHDILYWRQEDHEVPAQSLTGYEVAAKVLQLSHV